ncbi:ABC transporter substrate-binding protein [Paenibacillus puerhi]|uniref:ABC transporter substrate-binding protein n=1 Tax=Paenibacillus puerhi TaxID=2692622 RepID=UPI0013585D9B|nr:ABC transporter substrate-binding protein [Paenibacillus puerhi]
MNNRYALKHYAARFLVFILLLAITAGCGATAGNQASPAAGGAADQVSGKEEPPTSVTFTDSAGKEITLNLPVERVVVINRNTAEAIHLLGAADKVIATGDTTIKNNPYLGYGSIPDVGETSKVNLETVLSLKPQVVFAYTNRPDSKLEEKLEPAGIRVVRLNNYLPERQDEELKILGRIFQKEDKAEQFLQWKQSIEKLAADRVKDIPEADKKTVLALSVGYLNSNGGYRIFPSQSLGGKPGVGEGYATLLAGGKDAADVQWNPAEASTTILVDEEYVLKRNPDVITLHGTWLGGYEAKDTKPMKDAIDHIMNISSVSKLKAGQNKELYFFYTNFIGSDKRYIGTLQLAKLLYPDRFKDVDPDSYIKEYFEKWLTVPYQGIWSYSYKENN